MVTLALDHIAILAETLAEAVDHVERVIGLPMAPGGVHAQFGAHNALMGLDPALYIEAIAADPSAPDPGGARWFGLDAFRGPPRLDKWICCTDDLDAALRVLPMAGRPVSLSRGRLSWTMAVPEDGLLPFDGLFPALIQWHSDVPPGKSLTGSGVALDQLTVRHPEASALSDLLSPFLQAPLVRFETGDVGLEAAIRQGDKPLVLT